MMLARVLFMLIIEAVNVKGGGGRPPNNVAVFPFFIPNTGTLGRSDDLSNNSHTKNP